MQERTTKVYGHRLGWALAGGGGGYGAIDPTSWEYIFDRLEESVARKATDYLLYAQLLALGQAACRPRTTLFKTFTGTYTVATKADAIALAGTIVIGSITVQLTEEVLDVADFEVRSPPLNRALAEHKTLINYKSTSFRCRMHHCTIDGQNQMGAQGWGGDSFAQNLTLEYARITRCGFDGLRVPQGAVVQYCVLDEYPYFNVNEYGAYNGNADQNICPHMDQLQPQRRNWTVRYCIMLSNSGPSATSGAILFKTDIDKMYNNVLTKCLIGGGSSASFVIDTESSSLTNPGIYGYGEVAVTHCIQLPNYGDYPATMWSMGIPTTVLDSGARLVDASNNYLLDGTPQPLPVTTNFDLYDNMIGSSGALLSARSPQKGGTWIIQPGSPVPANELLLDSTRRARSASANTTMQLNGGQSSADEDVLIYLEKLSTLANDLVGCISRASGVADTYFFAGWDEAAQQIKLIKRIAGVDNVAGTYATTFSVGGVKGIRLRTIGDAITVYVATSSGGTLTSRITYTDTAALGGAKISAAGSAGLRFGVAQGASTGCHVSNIIGFPQ